MGRRRDPDVSIFDVTRAEDGKDRLKAVGRMDGRIYTVVYTERGAVAMTTPRAGEWERSYRALQEDARRALATAGARLLKAGASGATDRPDP